MAPAGDLVEGRFRIGATVAGRYRILGLLGRGGMGEVYRAHDVTLDQQVALKFLPEALGRDGAAVARFHNEVRVARQVTHPNVCRVHDIGEAEGVPFISMEFVDGEDLALLLQRIGRLPQDKGVEVAHALCAGLTAAHARGVLHRDLKPANIMLNRAGRVIIMDFGLAGVAAQLRGPDVLAGTPAYMAPEQLQGREVTTRSDLYALGLILYEIFTGVRVFRGAARGPVTAPSLVVKDLPPAIDRLVLACLNDDPQRRPASAMAVAQALPGVDPIAAAMRAGVTPSPEMLAVSRATVRLSVRAIAACFVASVALLVAAYVISPYAQDVGIAPPDTPPEALVARARDIATSVGYGAQPRDYAFAFERDRTRLAYLKTHGFDWSRLANARPGPFLWWYRQSNRWMVPRNQALSVTRDDPPPAAGEVEITLDARSRQLLSFSAIPDDHGPAGTAVSEPDWRPLFDAAGLDMARFTAATPGSPPAVGFDLRRAWVGSTAEQPDQPVRIEAAALGGRSVCFVLRYAWSAATEPEATEPRLAGAPALPMLIVGIVWTSLLAACLFARRNYRLGRLDVRGAATLAGATFWCTLAAWLLRAHATPTAGTLAGLSLGVGTALFTAGGAFVSYAGIDPYARRYWPASLVSWTRVVNGRFRDPLVGQDVLVGVLTGLVMTGGLLAGHLIERALWGQPWAGPELHLTLGGELGRLAGIGTFALMGSVIMLVSLLLLRAVVRRDWLAVVAFGVLAGVTLAPRLGSDKVLASVIVSASMVTWFWTLHRFGLLAAVVSTCVFTVTTGPVTWNLSLWYGPNMLLGAALILTVAVYGCRTALAGRPLFGRGVFGEGAGGTAGP
jgi:serine/threonine-protein kinase